MHSYVVYGLTVHSEISLPALLPGNGTADVEVRLGSLDEITADLKSRPWRCLLRPHEAHILWDEIATFVSRDGCSIVVDPAPDADERSVQLGVMGPAFATLLQQRGFLLLHASAVEIDGVAVAFMGSSGWGKSTMAAALHARGHRLVVDDVVAIRFESGQPEVYPGFPQFKLWPDALDALGADASALPAIDPEMDKRARRISEGFFGVESLPLGSVYVLGRGDSIEIEQLNARDAFLQLAYHSYGIQWLHEVSGPAYFVERAELARRLSVRRLRRPRDLQLLPDVVKMVEDDVAASA